MKNNQESSVGIYLKQAQKYKVLTREQEKFYITEYKNGSMEAYHTLINSNARFVFATAFKYKNVGIPLADLIQEGNIGLMDAIRRYKPEKDFRIISYAVWYIKAYVQKYAIKNFSIVNNKDDDLRIQLTGRREKHKKIFKPDHSLNAEIDSNGTHQTTYQDMLEAGVSFNPETKLIDAQNKDNLKIILDDALSKLTDAQQKVLRARLMNDKEDKPVFDDLAEEMGVTRQRVQQIEARGSERLKNIIDYDRENLFDMVT